MTIIGIKRRVCRKLYRAVARHLPESAVRGGLYRKIRVALARQFVASCSSNANIEKGAKFDSSVEIGDYSGIGINACLHGRVVIGKYVMMGPDCIIHTINHAFSRTDIPMARQGNLDAQPVTICDVVWIG